MYLPAHFEEADPEVMRRLIAALPLGMLVTVDEDGLHADHIPFLFEADDVRGDRLVGHVARGNGAWRRAGGTMESLVVFQGPSAYISPSWYATKAETHRVVPTYNYAVVHVYGRLVVHEDAKWIRGVVGKLTKRMESAFDAPWKMGDAPADYLEQQITNIVGVEIPIGRMAGKWKVSQNRDLADRAGAIDGLRAAGAFEQAEMAELIAAQMPS
jgi:transcriptional regulator